MSICFNCLIDRARVFPLLGCVWRNGSKSGRGLFTVIKLLIASRLTFLPNIWIVCVSKRPMKERRKKMKDRRLFRSSGDEKRASKH